MVHGSHLQITFFSFYPIQIKIPNWTVEIIEFWNEIGTHSILVPEFASMQICRFYCKNSVVLLTLHGLLIHPTKQNLIHISESDHTNNTPRVQVQLPLAFGLSEKNKHCCCIQSLFTVKFYWFCSIYFTHWPSHWPIYVPPFSYMR